MLGVLAAPARTLGAVVAAYDGDAVLEWSWVQDHTSDIWERVGEHVTLAALALLYGLLIALPLALLAHRYRRLLNPTLGLTGVLYTIPSLAFFAILLPFTGLDRATALVPLTCYTLLILVRNIVAGLDGVPVDVLEAARGMGYTRSRQLWRVELPIAVPAILAGIRIAAVTLIGLIPVAAVVGQGGLGTFMMDGFRRDFQTPLTVGIMLAVVLAVAADAALLALQRLVTPWARASRTR